MELISINVGRPRDILWRGKTISTAIFKTPVEGPVRLSFLNLDGDGQADLSVHGGSDKAVYLYPAEHYEFWRTHPPDAQMPDMDLTWGNFGENFTTRGLLEEHTFIGDTFRLGTALVKVTEPRMPCYKLGIRFGWDGMVKRFLAARRTGFYLAVLEEGTVQAGDRFTSVERPTHGITVADITRLYAFEKDDWPAMRRAAEVEDLPQGWRVYFLQQLQEYEQNPR